jgi:phosphoenolpyruvate carboxylase
MPASLLPARHDGADLAARLAERLAANRDHARDDPFTNPFLLFALRLKRDLLDGNIDLNHIEAALEHLTMQAFAGRADRLAAYLGDCDRTRNEAALTSLFERIAEDDDFEAFARAVQQVPFGMVLTGHPTFSLSMELSRILVELATGREEHGRELDQAARKALLNEAAQMRHGPPDPLTLDVEHAWSVKALENVHWAMERVYACALAVARSRWPDKWTRLKPRLLTLATWVGFDQDGRTDITWDVSFEKRLAIKRAALCRRRDAIEALMPEAAGSWAESLRAFLDLFGTAISTVDGQCASLKEARADPGRLDEFARAMVAGRRDALVSAEPALERLELALQAAPSDAARQSLLIVRAGLMTEGVSLARIHVRLNSSQLHNAIRCRVHLETAPTDPANRRTYFARIEELIGDVRAVEINFGDLSSEQASAPRLMMTVAQMIKFIDASTPVRFLIAETEAGFTLLTALYFARLFGVEDHVEISPLFETEEAFERGERVIEEALRSAHYRQHLLRQGRLAIEFGFSDSGRFIGQMAATYRIEHLRFRLAEMLHAQGLTELEVIFFNTHGESIGRGGHPSTLSDRFRYAAPARSRAEFQARGIRVKEEDAFQGGEGFLPIFTPDAALATVKAGLQSVLIADPEAEADPIYEEPDFAAEFFTTIEQAFAHLVADPDYAAFVGLYGTHLLPRTGSRPVQRQTDEAGVVRLKAISELRAIPNNAMLHQLGYLVNTLFGVGRAALKDRSTFADMCRSSPRFQRALMMAQAAYLVSDRHVCEAYAATFDPRLWIACAENSRRPQCDLVARDVAERSGVSEQLTRFLRGLDEEDYALSQIFGAIHAGGAARRERLLLLHSIRIALIQRVCELAMQVPSFNPQGATTLSAIRERLMRLDVREIQAELRNIFPRRAGDCPDATDYGEPSTYRREEADIYRSEHEAIVEPLSRTYALILDVSAAITHDIGAFG